MTDTSKNIKFSYGYNLIEEYNFSSRYGEILIRGLETLVLLSSSGGDIDTMMLPWEDKLIASNRNDSGWEVLLKREKTLILSKFSHDHDIHQVFLEQPEQDARTAVWSPCGKHIAVGNSHNSLLSVWHTETGKLHWKYAPEFEIEGEMINRPSLSVIGWSPDGNRIVVSAKYLLSCSIIVCDVKNGTIKSITS